MARLVSAALTRVDRSESLRLALLTGVSFLLGLTFIALLIADEAQASL